VDPDFSLGMPLSSFQRQPDSCHILELEMLLGRTLSLSRNIRSNYLESFQIRAPILPLMSRKPRRFAPLKDGDSGDTEAPRLEGIVFDVDGTLCMF
jgi:hypothetical protein